MEKTKHQKQMHNIPPVYDSNSKILILGSFPSVKSRESQFFYGHPQNRFWRVLAVIYNESVPKTIDEKRNFLLSHNIAVWDSIKSCDIIGSGDSTIQNVIPNDLGIILNNSSIKSIFANGTTSYNIYKKFIYPNTKMPIKKLPSTSPANAQYSINRLIEAWKIINN